MNAEQFNARYPVGTPVFAYPGFRPEDASDARRLVTRTRTKAQKSSSGDAVVWVDGEGSYVTLTHVDPVSESVFQAAREADALATAKSTAAVNPHLAAAIAAKGIPLSADLVDTGLSREARAARLADLRAREAARKVVLRGRPLLDHPLMDRIAFAIFDPGAIVPRGDNYQEPLHRWQAHAITFVLDEEAAS